MIFGLFLVLIILLMISFYAEHGDILEPSVIINASFLLCVFLAALYTDVWDLPMHLNTCLIIIGNILIFTIGTYLGHRAVNGCNNIRYDDVGRIYSFEVTWNIILYIVLFLLIILYFNYKELISVAQLQGDNVNFSQILSTAINKLQHGEAAFSRWYNYRYTLAKCIAYVSLFSFLYNMILSKRYSIKFLGPVIIYIPIIVCTAGRQDLVYLFIFFLVTSIFLYQYQYSFNNRAMIKVLYILGICFVMFVILFYAGGLVSGKIALGTNPTRVLAHYAGTNISAFDVFVNNITIVESRYYGELTLVGPYNNLRSMGFDLPVNYGYIDQFTQFDGITTNVYTALRRYIEDYGYVGCAAIMFILGFLYSFWYNYLKRVLFNPFNLILYSTFCYPIFLLCREERFLTSIPSTTTVYMIISMAVIYKLYTIPKYIEIKEK